MIDSLDMATLKTNPRIHVRKDNDRATNAREVVTRVTPITNVAVMRDTDKGSRKHKVRNTHLGIRPADARHPTAR